MEPSTFNLKQSVDSYINSIKNQGSITSSDAVELSAHLYDATDSLTKSGLSEEEAFIIACKRLGNEEVLTEEYSKVNPYVKMNKIWAYLIIGFNLFYSLPSLFLLCVSIIYLTVYRIYDSSTESTLIVTIFHLLVMALVFYIVGKKNEISQFIEKQVQYNTLRIVCLSFIPFLLPQLLTLIPALRITKMLNLALTYPIREFSSDLAEFSYYLAILSMIGGAVSLIFSINKTENLTLKTLFEKPSTIFLIVFGVVLELFAASTRSIGTEAIWAAALIFALVYFSASFLIAFYNANSRVNRYLIIAMFFGVAMELIAGIQADLVHSRLNTPYFVSFMLIGIALGKVAGLKSARRIRSQEFSWL